MPAAERWAAILAGVCACTPTPLKEVAALCDAIAGNDAQEVDRRIHAEYSDPLGGRARLLADIAAMHARWGRIDVALSETSAAPNPPQVEVVGQLQVLLAGEPGWKLVGPLRLELVRGLRWQVRSGLLADLRDIQHLMAARHEALEGNDSTRYAELLHPGYRDGDLDRDDAVARMQHDLQGVRIRHRPSHYRVEVRGPIAHVDERYTLQIGDRTLPATVARLTLKRSAGRWKIAAGLYAESATKPGS